MKYVNLTPRWTEILSHWFMIYENAIVGDCESPDYNLKMVKDEFARMAQAADNFNDLVAYLRSPAEGWCDDEIKNALKHGKAIQELGRITVKESQDDLS